jgi:hypothetical protein
MARVFLGTFSWRGTKLTYDWGSRSYSVRRDGWKRYGILIILPHISTLSLARFSVFKINNIEEQTKLVPLTAATAVIDYYWWLAEKNFLHLFSLCDVPYVARFSFFTFVANKWKFALLSFFLLPIEIIIKNTKEPNYKKINAKITNKNISGKKKVQKWHGNGT